MSELDNVAPGGVVQLNNPPAGLDDAAFDSLFPADSASVKVAPTTPAGNTQQTQTTQTNQQQTSTTQDFVLKGDTSVYKSIEDATKGINEKDALISQLRQRYALTTGIDPITGQPVGAQPQQPVEPDYFQDPDLYLKNLYEAAKTSPSAYRDAQAKFVMDTLKPLQPLVQKLARDSAIQSVATDIPKISEFIGSAAYAKALETNSELKGAIATAETDQRFHSRLGGLYKLAFFTAQGQSLPELLAAQAKTAAATTSQTATTTQPTQVRTTTQPTTTAAPTTTTRPTLRNLEGIRATIAQMEANGAKLDF